MKGKKEGSVRGKEGSKERKCKRQLGSQSEREEGRNNNTDIKQRQIQVG